MSQEKPVKKKVDPYRGVKYIGYRMAQLPDTYSLDQLVHFAKFQLAALTRTLLKDPIWDTYTIEEILVEYFAHQFHNNKEARTLFEAQLSDVSGAIDEFSDWADKEMAKEAKIREQTLGGTEDSVKFNPGEDIMGEDES